MKKILLSVLTLATLSATATEPSKNLKRRIKNNLALELEMSRANFWVSMLGQNSKVLNSNMSVSVLMTPQGTIDKDSFSNYFTDACEEERSDITNEDKLRSFGLRRCKDSTVSFVQPSSTGYKGWEGKCGQTAASNILYSYCKIGASPSSYTDNYLSDYTPGVRPGTLVSGLDDMFALNTDCPREASWHGFSYDYESDYIDAIRRGLKANISNQYKQVRKVSYSKTKVVTPVAVLIRVPGGKELHWITIVDIEENKKSCKFIVNHWDGQYKVDCSKIAKWSRGVADSYGLVLNKYYVVKYM